MITNKGKRAFLIIFALTGSYFISYMLDPYSTYWPNYFERSWSEITLEWLISLLICAFISELSLFLDDILNKKMPWTIQPVKRLIVQCIIQVTGVLAVILLLHIIFSQFYPPREPTLTEIKDALQWTIATVLIALMISAINTGNFLLLNWKATALEAAEHQVNAAKHKQVAAEAELQALKLQLDTHFVFNNLSVLSELILENQQMGYLYAENFTKVYRYLLVNSKKNLITLEEELKFLDAYLFLIKKRRGDGVIFAINIEQDKLSFQLPPLTLQLLIENALKHNRTISDDPLLINVYSNVSNELIVENKLLPLVTKPESAGIGLDNIKSRYALISDEQPVVEVSESMYTVKIPLII